MIDEGSDLSLQIGGNIRRAVIAEQAWLLDDCGAVAAGGIQRQLARCQIFVVQRELDERFSTIVRDAAPDRPGLERAVGKRIKSTFYQSQSVLLGMPNIFRVCRANRFDTSTVRMISSLAELRKRYVQAHSKQRTMNIKAIGFNEAGPTDNLAVIELARPQIGPRDLLVAVKGISVNAVDDKLRAAVQPEGAPRVLGLDAARVVAEIGDGVTGYKVGDEV